MISKEEKEEIEEKIRNMPSLALIQTVSEMLEEEETSIEVLKILREEMKRRKFNSPFGFLVNITKSEEYDEDSGKQNAYFRRIATLKKYSYYSTLISIAARRIKKTVERNNYNDFIAFLPINGNYLYNIMQYGYFGLITYRTIYDHLKESGDREKAVVYEIEGENYYYRKKVKEGASIDISPEERIKGKKESVKINSIIRSIAVRKALCSAITGYSGFLAFNKASKKASKDLKTYNEIISRRGYIAFYNVDSYLEIDKGLKQDLENAGMIKNASVKEEIKRELLEMREEISREMLKYAKLMLAIPLAKHYLLKSEMKRKINPLYPSLSVNPSKEQLKLFSIVEEYVGFPLGKAIEEKIEKENLGDSRIIALGVVGEKYGVENAVKFFNATKEEVINAINYIKKPKLGRGKDFLEKLKD